MHSLIKPALLCWVTLVASPVLAKDAIYKWVDKDGVTHYGSKPPSDTAKPADLPPLQTYQPAGKSAPIGTLEAASTASKPANPAVPVLIQSVQITSPAPDEIFRDPSQPITVTAKVLPSAPAGASYAYYLNGQLQNAKAWPAANYPLKDVERGSHTVTVAVLDANGKEIKRSAPVRFSSQPPRVR
jgi:hypothetical protein